MSGRLRRLGEIVAQAAALMLLAWALVLALRPDAPPGEAVTGAPDVGTLTAWSTARAPDAAHVLLAEPPAPVVRDWLSALARSGTHVAWSGGDLVPLALAIEPIPDPRGGHRVRIAASEGADVLVGDAAGAIDSLRVASPGAALAMRTLVGNVRARTASGAGRAAAPVPRPTVAAQNSPTARAGGGAEDAPSAGVRETVAREIVVREVLVLGSASWESRFVIGALEEAGWRVTARMAVAPDVWVEQGSLGVIDTSRFGAVVVLDTAVGPWGEAVARFASRGGGVVLAGTAARVPALRPIAPGRPGEYVPAGPGTPSDSAPLRGLSVHPVVLRSSDALALERRGATVTVAARRHRLGRVVQIAHDDTWRWRMGGGEDAPRAHREWWSRLLTSVSYAPGDARHDEAFSPDAAPVAHLWDALGPPLVAPVLPARRDAGLPWWILPSAALLLLGSWGSRRLRGVA